MTTRKEDPNYAFSSSITATTPLTTPQTTTTTSSATVTTIFTSTTSSHTSPYNPSITTPQSTFPPINDVPTRTMGKSESQILPVSSVPSAIVSVPASIQPTSNQVAEMKPCQLYVGSFQLVNEVYQDQYNDSSSDAFQSQAMKLCDMISRLFENSFLIRNFENCSVFALRPNPFTVHCQLQFCNSSSSSPNFSKDTVTQELIRMYQEKMKAMSFSLNISSVMLAHGGSCIEDAMQFDVNAEWPWQVSLQENGVHVCVGSLVSEIWVLSPANCVNASTPSRYSVLLGSNSRNSYNVAEIIAHPSCTSDSLSIALLHLEEPVWFSSIALPICLPDAQRLLLPETACWAATWTSKNFDFGSFQKAEGIVSSSAGCLGLSQNLSLCTRMSASENTPYQMDPGASLSCPYKDSAFYLDGLVPYKQNFSLSSPYVTFVRTGPFVAWIQSYILT